MVDANSPEALRLQYEAVAQEIRQFQPKTLVTKLAPKEEYELPESGYFGLSDTQTCVFRIVEIGEKTYLVCQNLLIADKRALLNGALDLTDMKNQDKASFTLGRNPTGAEVDSLRFSTRTSGKEGERYVNVPNVAISLDNKKTPVIDAFVSARHCQVIRKNGRWFLKDIGSKNGTYIPAEDTLAQKEPPPGPSKPVERQIDNRCEGSFVDTANCGAAISRGKKRSHQQDLGLVVDKENKAAAIDLSSEAEIQEYMKIIQQSGIGLYLLADGMGGQEAGEQASLIASLEIVKSLGEFIKSSQWETFSGREEVLKEQLKKAVAQANDAFLQFCESKNVKGGTTLTAALVVDNTALITHVGDSRAYLWRQGELVQITKDHTWVQAFLDAGEITSQEAANSRRAGQLFRHIGIPPVEGEPTGAEPDIFVRSLLPGDRLLLCSDGLTGMVEDDQINKIIGEATTCGKAAKDLVDQAMENGGKDNITVIVAGF